MLIKMEDSKLASFFILLCFLTNCSNNTLENQENQLTEQEEQIREKILVIKEEIFTQANPDTWALALVGSKETIINDLCGNSVNCDYSYDRFQKLEEGNEYYEQLSEKTKELISQSNEYFTGNDVVVYDENNDREIYDLNALDPILGNHVLALIDRETIEPLHENDPSFGNLYWPEQKTSLLEAFSSDNNCVNAYNKNSSACLTADNNVLCLVEDDNNSCTCYSSKNESEDSCGYVDLTLTTPVTTYRVEAYGQYYDSTTPENGTDFGTLTFNQSPYIFSQMMNTNSNANAWYEDCETLAKGVVAKNSDMGAYCYTQTGALGFGFPSQQYIYICSGDSCYHPEITGNTTVCGSATCTLWGELLAGAATEVEAALENFTVGTGSTDVAETETDEGVAEAVQQLAEVAGAIVGE